MRRLTAAVLLAALLGTRAEAREPALYFRLDAGGEPVLGCVYPGRDGVLAAIRLDLDGDGIPREVPAGRETGWGGCTFGLTRDGRDFELTLHEIPAPCAAEAGVSWKVTAGGETAYFLHGILPLYPSLEEAARGRPFRMGPPFRFEVAAGAQGPRAVLSVALRDANGAAFRAPGGGVDGHRIEVRILRESCAVQSAVASYG